MTQTAPTGGDPRTTGQLAVALTDQVSRLVKDEVALATADVKTKVSALAKGGGMLAAAGVLGFFGLVALFVAGGLGLAVYFSDWLSALIVAGVFLVVTAVLALVGLRSVKRGAPPVPKEAIAGLKTDLSLVKGITP